MVLARWCNTQAVSQTSGETAAPRTVAAFSGPSTGRPLGRSGPNQGPNHPRHAPLGLLGRFGALINGLPPPDLDHSLLRVAMLLVAARRLVLPPPVTTTPLAFRRNGNPTGGGPLMPPYGKLAAHRVSLWIPR